MPIHTLQALVAGNAWSRLLRLPHAVRHPKLKGYADLQIASSLAYWICFCFRHPRREAGARRVLSQATVPVATAALGPTQRPHEAIWAPVGYEGIRLRLAELLSMPIPAESEERIAETQAYRRRSEEQRRAARSV